ncbi:MAG: hypothetical protein ABS916_00210 [Carnobacterium sp.]|uniref:hypothetical protein n=1 Tax=Carnobacterium sp. TaxID=48221 RepID=UPI00331529EA
MDWIYISSFIGLVTLGCLQYYFGYRDYKKLGMILPIIFIGLVIYFIIKGTMTFSVRDILMPLLVLFTLAGVYNNGYEKKQKAINKELDKMKAKDQQSMQ